MKISKEIVQAIEDEKKIKKYSFIDVTKVIQKGLKQGKTIGEIMLEYNKRKDKK